MNFKKSACIEPMYSELPFYDRFKAAADDGFEAVEFWGWTDKDLDKVKEAAAKAGVTICGFNGDAEISMIDPDSKRQYIDYVKKSVEAAKKVGALSVTIHSNGLGDGGVVINSFNELSDTVKICTMYDNLKECAKIATESGINMNLEGLNITTDHVGNYLKNTSMAAELVKMVNCPRIKILYDVYHMQLNEGSLCDNIVKYAAHLGHIHVADAPGRHEPGTGEINYTNVFKCLEQVGYKGYVGFELMPKTSTEEAVKAIMSY